MLIRREVKKARYGQHVCVVAAAVLVLSIVVLHGRHEEQEAVAARRPRSPVSTGAAAFGTQSSPEPALSGVVPDEPGLAITESHELIVNGALLDLIDSFLLDNDEGDRADRLKRYLKSKLPAPADGEAMQIVEHYQTYMAAHDDLLAAQNLRHVRDGSVVDIDRIAIWRQQRDRLRRSVLGDDVVQTWYQNDDAQLDQVLHEWRQRSENNDASQSQSQAPRYPVPHWHDKKAEEHHRQYMLGVLDKAVTSFADRRRTHGG